MRMAQFGIGHICATGDVIDYTNINIFFNYSICTKKYIQKLILNNKVMVLM